MELRGVKHAPDMENPLTDTFAKELAQRTPASECPVELPFGATWEKASPEYRDFFRARARQFLAGDLSVMPFTRRIGERG